MIEPTEKSILLQHLARLGPPPFTLAASELQQPGSRTWGAYSLDWGLCGPRGNPDDVAGLRGLRRPKPSGPGYLGDYIGADEIRKLLK